MNDTRAGLRTDVVAVQAHYWLIEFDAGELAPADRWRFIRWLNASPVHWNAYTGLLSEWRRWDAPQRLRTEVVDHDVVGKWLRWRNWRRRDRTGLLP